MTEGDFAKTSFQLGNQKAGQSKELDNNELTPNAVTGKDIFNTSGCLNSHISPWFSDDKRPS